MDPPCPQGFFSDSASCIGKSSLSQNATLLALPAMGLTRTTAFLVKRVSYSPIPHTGATSSAHQPPSASSLSVTTAIVHALPALVPPLLTVSPVNLHYFSSLWPQNVLSLVLSPILPFNLFVLVSLFSHLACDPSCRSCEASSSHSCLSCESPLLFNPTLKTCQQ